MAHENATEIHNKAPCRMQKINPQEFVVDGREKM